MKPITVTNDQVHLVWPLLQSLYYDNLLDALVHGYHGEMITDSLNDPTVFLGWIGWNYYLTGDVLSPHADAIISKIPVGTEIHTTDDWVIYLSQKYGQRLKRKTRYAHSAENLNEPHLKSLVELLKPEYKIKQIDASLYTQILKDRWGSDFVENFKDFDDFYHHGLGYVIMHKDKIISGISSYIRYNGGYEIEIITHPDYRGQGLAMSIAAQFCLTCLKQNKTPYWDAAHEASMRLAKRIGFTFTKAYEVLIIGRDNG